MLDFVLLLQIFLLSYDYLLTPVTLSQTCYIDNVLIML